MAPFLKRLAYRAERGLYRRGLIPKRARPLPHFLGIGPGQTGTTWLARHLGAHPEVFVAPRKELDYFSKHFDRVSLLDYASNFLEAGSRIRGEISPSYSIMTPSRIASVAQLLPDAKLILTVRNPIDRSWSAARRLTHKLGVSMETLGEPELFEYLRLEWQYRPSGVSAMVGEYQPGLLEGHYTRILENWNRQFPEPQLLVVFFDDIKERARKTLVRVCEYLGVDSTRCPIDDVLREPVNKNPPQAMPDRVRIFLEQQYRAEIEALASRFGGPANEWLAGLD